jgi:hypothetical protein
MLATSFSTRHAGKDALGRGQPAGCRAGLPDVDPAHLVVHAGVEQRRDETRAEPLDAVRPR